MLRKEVEEMLRKEVEGMLREEVDQNIIDRSKTEYQSKFTNIRSNRIVDAEKAFCTVELIVGAERF